MNEETKGLQASAAMQRIDRQVSPTPPAVGEFAVQERAQLLARIAELESQIKGCTFCGSDEHMTAVCPMRAGGVKVVGYACAGQIEVLQHVPLTGGMKVSGRERERYTVPLMTVAQHQLIVAASVFAAVIRCEQKGAFKTCMECGYQDGHDPICQYHESKRAVVRAGGVDEWEAQQCLYVLREIGSMDVDDISGDDIDLRFEDGDGRDTGCDVSIVEYAERSAVVIEKLIAALNASATKCQTCNDSGVVSTTDKDHNGDHIEQRCPACSGETVIDLDAMAWAQIKEAASQSAWIPEQYFMNDWVSDVCAFLREPRAVSAGEPVAWVHPAYLKPGALGFEASVCRLSSLQVPLYTHPADQVAEGVRLDGLVRANQQMGRIYLHFKTTEQQHVALRGLRALLAKT